VTVKLNSGKRTVRTVFAALVGLAAMAPLIYSAAAHQDPAQATGLLAAVLAIAGGITRVMTLPVVEVWLQKFVPWLAADPNAEHVSPPDDIETPAEDSAPAPHGYVIANVPERDQDGHRVCQIPDCAHCKAKAESGEYEVATVPGENQGDPDNARLHRPEHAYPEDGGPPLT
jgi:hypothetical protein